MAIRGADHVQPPEDNAELLLATLNSPQRPSSRRGSLSPHSVSPRKRKTRVMNATSSGGGKSTGNHTDIANLISNQMNAPSDSDKESKTDPMGRHCQIYLGILRIDPIQASATPIVHFTVLI